MTDSADIPFLADVIEARQYDELVVEHVFEAMIDEDGPSFQADRVICR